MKRIYKPEGRAAEYSPWALNHFTGCDYACTYCYVPRIISRYRPQYNHNNVHCVLDENGFKMLEVEMQGFSASKHANEQILLSFTCDPYCRAEAGETRRVLELAHKYDLHIAILTKNPGKALRDADIMREMKHFKLGATLTCSDAVSSRMWETNAPVGKERIEALMQAKKQGIKTWASLEPVIYPEQTLQILRDSPEFADHVMIGKINNHPRERQIYWPDFIDKAISIIEGHGIKACLKRDLRMAAFNLPEKYETLTPREYDV